MIKVKSWEGIRRNAHSFNGILKNRDNKVFEVFSRFYHWYYFPDDDIFAPSKFIGYEDTKLDKYACEGTGGDTQIALSEYFTEVPRGTPDHDRLRAKLSQFAARVGKGISRATFEGKGAIYVPNDKYLKQKPISSAMQVPYSTAERNYFFTCNDPRVDRNHHSIWMRTKDMDEAKKATREIEMGRGDWAFIYETKYDRGHRRSDGRSEVVALVQIRDVRFTLDEHDDWVNVATTTWVAEVKCPEADTKRMVGRLSFRTFGRLNVLPISHGQALQLMEYATSRDIPRLVSECLLEQYGDLDERTIHNARPAVYQETPRKTEWVTSKGGKRPRVDASISKRRFILADYRCEADSQHTSFMSKTTGRGYVESHHLVPLGAQRDFGDNSLDHETNIFALCPNCHRKLHHSTMPEKTGLLRDMFLTRKSQLETAGIVLTAERLLSYYI